MEIIAFATIIYIMLAVQSMLFNKLVFRDLDYKCEFSTAEAHEGEEIYLVETVHNKKLLPVPWLKADINSSKWLEYAGTRSVVAQEFRYVTSNFFLKSYQRITRRWKLKCLKRGVYKISKVTLITGDPFGINTNSLPVDTNTSLVVYPDIIDFDAVFIPAGQLQGDIVVKRWIMEDPFLVSGTREYMPGDPMKKVHWNATAREGRLMVRKNDFTTEVSLTVILNIQAVENEYYGSVDRNLIELGIKASATMLDRALRNGIPARFATNGCTIDDKQNVVVTGEAAGREHIRGLYDVLARLELRRVRDFENFLEDISYSFENNDVVIISCYITPKISELLIRLKDKRNRVTLVMLDHIDEREVPAGIDTYHLPESEYKNA